MSAERATRTNARRAIRWSVLAVLLASCGGAAHYRRDVEPERDDPEALVRQQVALETELAGALARPEPDCGAACTLSGRTCELADRICAIADRHAQDETLRERCEDGSQRCERARAHVGERCTCE